MDHKLRPVPGLGPTSEVRARIAAGEADPRCIGCTDIVDALPAIVDQLINARAAA